MTVLVINSGSSSLKYTLFAVPHGRIFSKGIIERIGGKGAEAEDHRQAVSIALNRLEQEEKDVSGGIQDIGAVGHRVVHGGEDISHSVEITDDVIRVIEKYSVLAPLHNPPNLAGIYACRSLLPRAKQIAVFDTAYYQSMRPESYLYGLPYEFYEKYKIRKYGFHGTSHRYAAEAAAGILKRPADAVKVITCHLGNGCSITASEYGKAVDTSMGFTPLEGLLMGTRCGDIDPAVVLYLMEKENINTEEINRLLNKRSGLLGVSGVSNDMRDIHRAAGRGSKRAAMAVDIFVYRVQKYIGAYMAVMNGADALVFTAGIGENDPVIREKICKRFSCLGIEIDSKKNTCLKGEGVISSGSSRCKVLVIPANEELMIAQDTMSFL